MWNRFHNLSDLAAVRVAPALAIVALAAFLFNPALFPQAFLLSALPLCFFLLAFSGGGMEIFQPSK